MTAQALAGQDGALRIAAVPVGRGGGLVGIAAAPGRRTPPAAPGLLGLQADLDVVAAWGAAVVVTLLEPHEVDSLGIGALDIGALGIGALGAEVRRRGMRWHGWPIPDFGVPDAGFMRAWPRRSAMLAGVLGGGGRVLIHCKGGLGRSGSVAARLLVEAGNAPADAIAAVRAARPHAVETDAQAAWVAAGRPRPA